MDAHVGAPSPDERLLRQLLRRQARTRVTPPAYAYGSPQEFVLREGERFQVRRLADMPHGLCYGNSINVAALFGWSYVEGYALPPIGRIGNSTFAYASADVRTPLQHAWVVTDTGEAIDLTWRKPGRAYLGVRFGVDRAHDCTWEGDASVLEDDKRGWPLLRELWAGETYEHRRTPLLEALLTVFRTSPMPVHGLPPRLRTPTDRDDLAAAVRLLEAEGLR